MNLRRTSTTQTQKAQTPPHLHHQTLHNLETIKYRKSHHIHRHQRKPRKPKIRTPTSYS